MRERPFEVFEGEYVEVADPDIHATHICIAVEFSDTDSMFDDTDRFPSFDSVWNYLDERIEGITEMIEPIGGQEYGILIERPIDVDVQSVIAEVKAVIKGRQEWRGAVPFEDELGEEML